MKSCALLNIGKDRVRTVRCKMATTRIIFTGVPEGIKRSFSVMEQHKSPGPTPRKRQRLTHLTPEEKMLRRKLKNRVAAQTARDRKKAHMDNVEGSLELTQLANQELISENEALTEQNRRLVSENQELRRRLGLLADVKVETKTDEDIVAIKKEVISPESAALNAPPQQAQIQLISAWLATLLCLSLTCYWDCLKICTPKTQRIAMLDEAPLKPARAKTVPTQWWGPQQKSWNPSKN